MSLTIATCISLCAMAIMWATSSLATIQKIQSFNGALTIPLVGGIWIFAFIFMFLVPSREASFRGQEALESVGVKVENAVDKILPAIEVIERLAIRVEKDYPEILAQVRDAMDDLKTTSKKIEDALKDNAALAKDARPVLEALKRIEERIEGDMLDDVQIALEAVKRMSLPPGAGTKTPSGSGIRPASPALSAGAPAKASEPNLSAALSLIGKKKAETAQPKV